MSLLTLSKTVQDAIQTMVYLTLNQNKHNSVTSLSNQYGFSKTYLSKIVQILSSKKLIKTSTGRNGGIALNKSPKSVKIIDIVNAVNAKSYKKKDRCFLGIGECNEETHCPIHHSWKSVKETIHDKLSNQNLETLSKELFKKINS
jgi:Rrf2 family protein